MRPKSLALLMLALGCGLVASIGITQVLANRNIGPDPMAGQSKAIFVAVTDIGLGDLVTAQMLKLEQWPKDKIPQGAITRIEDVEGRRTRTKLYAGEPILENRLLGKGASQQGATALIPKGYRVVPVSVNLVSGGSSLILPGDRVDVMVHFVRDPSRDIPETVTRTILQDIKVFAVNDVIGLESEKDNSKSIAAKTISLLVTPEQAAKITLASQLGTIQLVMRSPEDDQQPPNVQARPSELVGISKTHREKESLVEPQAATPESRTKSFLDFLNSMAAKAPAGPPTDAKRSTWTVRVIKPGSVEDVQLEAEETKTASAMPFGTWKSSGSSSPSTSNGGTAAPENGVAPPPAAEPNGPAAGPLLPPSAAGVKPDKVATGN